MNVMNPRRRHGRLIPGRSPLAVNVDPPMPISGIGRDDDIRKLYRFPGRGHGIMNRLTSQMNPGLSYLGEIRTDAMKGVEITRSQFRLEAHHLPRAGIMNTNVDPLGAGAQQHKTLRKMVGTRNTGEHGALPLHLNGIIGAVIATFVPRSGPQRSALHGTVIEIFAVEKIRLIGWA